MATFDVHGLRIPDHWTRFLTTSQVCDIDRMREFLVKIGMTGKMLAVQSSEEDRRDFFRQISAEVSLPDNDQLEILFNFWIDEAVKCLPLKRRLGGDHASLWLCNMRDAVSFSSNSSTTVNSSITPAWACVPRPSKLRKSRLGASLETTANEREMLERRELDKWSVRLYQLYDQRGAPIAKQVDACLNPGRATLEIAGGTRPRTLKAYLGHWYRFEAYLLKTVNRSWPNSAQDFVNFLHVMADEPCAPTVPESFMMAARFIEKKSGLPEVEKFCDSPLVKAVLLRTNELLKGPTGPTKRAPRFPAVVIEALEGLVMDPSAGKYHRGVAWLRLVKTWASMRFSCHYYLSPARLTMFEGELFGTLKKTKTTGPSRRIKELPIHISKSAFVRFGSWLQVGFELWQTLAPFERDYFLPKPTVDGQHTIPRLAEYSDAAASGIEVLSILRVPGSHVLLLDSNWCAFFTEHSERPTMTTALVVLQSSKEERDAIGRWRPEGSDVYVRTYHALVARLQEKVASAMREVNRFELLQEKEIAQSFKTWVRDRHDLTAEDADAVADSFLKMLKTPPQVPQQVLDIEEEDVPDLPTDLVLDSGVSSDSSEDVPQKDWFLAENRPGNSFLVVRNKKGQGRLHRSDGCWIARYRAVKFPHLCDQEPDESTYDFRCRLCWPSIASEEMNSSQSSGSDSAAGEADLGEESDPALGGNEHMEDLGSEWSVTAHQSM
jgi:hypothetical protein